MNLLKTHVFLWLKTGKKYSLITMLIVTLIFFFLSFFRAEETVNSLVVLLTDIELSHEAQGGYSSFFFFSFLFFSFLFFSFLFFSCLFPLMVVLKLKQTPITTNNRTRSCGLGFCSQGLCPPPPKRNCQPTSSSTRRPCSFGLFFSFSPTILSLFLSFSLSLFLSFSLSLFLSFSLSLFLSFSLSLFLSFSLSFSFSLSSLFKLIHEYSHLFMNRHPSRQQ